MEIKIEKLVYGGKGIGKINDKICFVPFVLPNEIVDVEIVKEKKSFFECKLNEIIEPSPYRIEPVCKYFTYCGGCDYQHIDYKNEVNIKKEILEETLSRIGKFENIKVDKVIPSEREYFYRNRTQLKVWGNTIGFYKKESNQIVDIDSCYLIDEEINNGLNGLRELIQFLDFRPLEIHIYKTNQSQILIKFVYNRKFKRFPLGLKHLRAFFSPNIVGIGIYEKKGEFLKRFITIGKTFGFEKIEDIQYRVSIDSFFQINKYQVKNLIKEVVDEIKDKGYKKALDLYCGVGTLTFPLAKYVDFVIGIESNPFAIQDANHNKKLNNLKNIKFYRMEAQDIDKLEDIQDTELVVIDPPRSGLSKKLVNFLLDMNSIDRIIYVSCNPSTLARDLNLLSEKYEIEKVKMIDMFPRTYHIETIAVLRKIKIS
jgi:23S rRNA (uracil1939-C5)-methyltransferase